MKHKKDEIIEIAKLILKQIDFKYDLNEELSTKEVDPDTNNRSFEKDTWMVWIPYGKPLFPKNRTAILFIDDETGNPLFMHHSQAKIILTVNEDGTIEETVKRIGEK
jgi:hypothetical protein